MVTTVAPTEHVLISPFKVLSLPHNDLWGTDQRVPGECVKLELPGEISRLLLPVDTLNNV